MNTIKTFEQFNNNSFFAIAKNASDQLQEVRKILDNRFHIDMTDEQFDKLQTVYDHICKALDEIL